MTTSSKALKIGIQGVAASFHDVAARKHFAGQSLTVVECDTFKILCERLNNGHADYCMMAIENTIAGSILTNYSLLERYGFRVMGEVYLPIGLNLMALPGQSIDQLKFVQSHPMALFQCEDFLFKYKNLKILEANDTAESAKDIAGKKLLGYGAIASRLAAETYGLEVLEANIETNKSNYTRFLVVCRADDYQRAVDANKASLRFEAKNEPGSLFGVLEIFKRHEVNMTKIQSVPLVGKPYQYSIHIDAEWERPEAFKKLVNDLSVSSPPLLQSLAVLGEYKKQEGPTS